MVVPGNASLLAERATPFVDALFIHAVKCFVKDGLDDRAKIGTAHDH